MYDCPGYQLIIQLTTYIADSVALLCEFLGILLDVLCPMCSLSEPIEKVVYLKDMVKISSNKEKWKNIFVDVYKFIHQT